MSYEPHIRDDVIELGCWALAAVAVLVASFLACWSGGAFGNAIDTNRELTTSSLAASRVAVSTRNMKISASMGVLRTCRPHRQTPA